MSPVTRLLDPLPKPAPDRRLPPDATHPSRHFRARRRGPLSIAARVTSGALAVLLASGLGVTAFAWHSVASNVRPGIALPGEDDVADGPAIGEISGPIDVLLVGSDSGEGNPAYGERGATLADVTMLLHVSADRSSATVVSFPRDLFVDIPACPDPDGDPAGFAPVDGQKLNSALSRGGLACSVLTIRELTGLDIPYAAQIEFDGVVAMSTAVGGVEVCVATPIDDRQLSFELDAGTHLLSGADALQFLRSRYGVGDGSDLARISNQQQFLASLVRTLKSSETLSNPIRLYGIATAAVDNLTFSNSLRDVDTMVAIAGALNDIPLEEIVFVSYPSGAGSSGGASGVVPIEDAATQLFDALAADEPIGLTGQTGRGTVADPDEPDPDEPEPTEPEPTEQPDPGESDPGEPDPIAAPLPGSGAPAPSPTPDRVQLPESVQGQDASQTTCTAGQTAGG